MKRGDKTPQMFPGWPIEDKPPHFDGSTYEPQEDHARLTGQLERVREVMADGQWRTLRQLSIEAEGSEASVSARLRDLRKPKFGAHQVERQRVAGGLFQYRIGTQPEERQ